VTVTELTVGGYAAAGGKISLTLKNHLSGKQMEAEAHLVGPGFALPYTHHNVGKKENPILTNEKIGFRQFENTLVVVDKLKLVYGVGYGRLALWFPLLGADSIVLESGWDYGLKTSGYVIDGLLHLVGNNPDDYIEKTRYPIVQERNQVHGGIILIFPTGHHELPKSESDRLGQYLEMWYHLLTET
jgi:hypothetical protein